MGKRLRVPDYDVLIEPHELLVMNTPTFQRLFRVYQLGLAYLIYPFATHTRAAHVIEALNYSQRILDALRKRADVEPLITDNVVNRTRFAALLHDIAHLPFGHTLEDENVVFGKHDEHRLDKFLAQLESEIVPLDLPRLSLLRPEPKVRELALSLIDRIKPVLWTISYGDKPKDKRPTNIRLLELEDWFIADIVGNTISADLLAYVKRDVEYTGIEKRHGGYRIFDYLTLATDEAGRQRLAIRLTKAGFRIDVFSAILDVLDVRYALMERVVFHHAKCAASAMLARACRLAGITEELRLYSMGDERFLAHIEAVVDSTSGPPERSAIKNLLSSLNSRSFYKRIYRVTYADRASFDKGHSESFSGRFRDPRLCTQFENEIEDKFRLPRGAVSVFCPKEDMHLKEAKVMVTWDKVVDPRRRPEQIGCYPLNSQDFKEDYPESPPCQDR